MTGSSTYRSTLQQASTRKLGSVLKILATAAAAGSMLFTLTPAAGAQGYRHPYTRVRHHVAARARDQRGAPYRSGGTSPSGFDCSGFTRWVFSDIGLSLPHSSQAQFDLGSRRAYKRIHSKRNLRRGDLVFQHTTGSQVGHAGIYLGHGRFISSTSSGGVRIRSINDPYYWGPRFVGGIRTPATLARRTR